MNATEMKVVQLKESNNRSRDEASIEGCTSVVLKWRKNPNKQKKRNPNNKPKKKPPKPNQTKPQTTEEKKMVKNSVETHVVLRPLCIIQRFLKLY